MNRMQLSRWLIGHTRPLLATLTLSVLARIAGQLFGVALFIVAAHTIWLAATGSHLALWPLIAWLSSLALLKALLRYCEHYTGHWVAFTALKRLRELFFERLIPQAPAATTGFAGAELTERATGDIQRIEVFFAHTIPPAVSAFVTPAITLIWLGVVVDGPLAVVLAVSLAIMVAIPAVMQRAGWDASVRVAKERGNIAAHLGDDVQGSREITAFHAQTLRHELFDTHSERLRVARVSVANIRAFKLAATLLAQALSLIAPLLAAAHWGGSSQAVILTLAGAVALWGPVGAIEGFMGGLHAAFASAQRLQGIMDAPPAVCDTPTPRPLPAHAGINFDGVSARHPGSERFSLCGVSAHISPASWNYVVGVSGSGKSTLVSLIVRSIDVETGRVSLGGVDVRELSLDSLRRQVAFVSQHPTLISGTIADNLRLAAPGASEAQMRQALNIVSLQTWVDQLPQGFNTRVSARGLSVSGGQLQRLAIARALIADPAVLILDEALSQLDEATAAAVRKRLSVERKKITVIEVTHRADLVPDDANVVVIDAGSLVEAGFAGTLRASPGPFTRLEARQ